MAGVSNFTAAKLLDTLHRNGTAFQPAGLFLAVFTTNPDFDSGSGGVEAVGGGYARKAVTFSAAVGGSCSNSNQIEFTAGTDLALATYTGFAIYDAQTNGNMLEGKGFSAAKTVSGTGDKLSFGVGSIVTTLD